ncbi:MAG: winged helix-turn-helix transcriptional regulator [Nitrospiraceae bacterium]|nr:winged helix-turn-helix transcriptional regulator [Nitrospiraceae bacterium]
MFMRTAIDHFKLLADASRIRILLLLDRKELCVCQIMGVLGMSQPLVSRNLSLLMKGGYLDDRREGKMIFYSLKKNLPLPQQTLMDVLRSELSASAQAKEDLRSLRDCTEFQKKTGKCDMETYLSYMRQKKAGRK